jgi:histo-blood group ABO system transferase
MRYHAMLARQALLSQYAQLLYMDIDMLACSKIEEEEIFSDGITAALHAGYVTTFERRPQSTAFVKGAPPYYQGCLIGGDAKAFLGMCETIARNIDIDDTNGIVAIWHDESHLNRYLFDNPPAKVLSPAYCFPTLRCLVHPERWMKGDLASFVPKIRHLEKACQDKWKDGG